MILNKTTHLYMHSGLRNNEPMNATMEERLSWRNGEVRRHLRLALFARTARERSASILLAAISAKHLWSLAEKLVQ